MSRTLHLSTLGLMAVASTFFVGCGDKDTADTATDDTGSTACADGVCIVSGIISDDTTWTADNEYLLRGGVFVGNDADTTVLTIEPGTRIYGETATDGMLVVTRNSRIEAVGTAEAPIVFSSSVAEGSRASGDWGGLILNGNAPLNVCFGTDDADSCEAFGEGGTGWYGGTDASDNSGTLSYVRVEFAGSLISPENELNGIAFQGVGSGTTIDHIQVHKNDDDGVEFYGGTAKASHVVVSGVGDDALDWTDGWQGEVDTFILHVYSGGDQGIEADNNGENNDAEPRAKPTIKNGTIWAMPAEGTGDDKKDADIGILVREGTAGSFENILVGGGFSKPCLEMNHDATYDQWDSGELTFTGLVLACEESVDTGKFDDAEYSGSEFETDLGSDITVTTDALIADGDNATAPDFTSAGSYQGALPAGSEDWTAGWTAFPAN